MKEQKKGKWSIIGMIALVVVLFIGVKIAFAALDLAIGQNQPDVIRQPLSTESGGDSQTKPTGWSGRRRGSMCSSCLCRTGCWMQTILL